MDDWRAALSVVGLTEVLYDEPMANHTSFRVGGPAEALIVPASLKELAGALAFAHEHEVPCRVIGAGSNVIVRDGGVQGIVVKIWKSLGEICFTGDTVYAAAGAPMPKLAKLAADRGLGGLEFAAGIPGTVGGAITMNAGAHGAQTSDYTERVELIDNTGARLELANAQMRFRYRHSLLHEDPTLVVAGAVFRLPQEDRDAIRERMRGFAARRKRTQPLGVPSSGSMFKNPSGDYAARLIEAAGLKGARVGGVSVSTLHANFMLNEGQGCAADVAALIDRVRATVQERFAVELELEVEWIGRHERSHKSWNA